MNTIHVSIIVPTFCRPDGLRACLEGLSRMDLETRHAEVIVVDDGGPGSVNNIVADFEHRLPIRLLKKSNGGPASARNTGAFASRGRFLAFIDDDCVPQRGWIASLLEVLDQNPGALVGGPVMNGLPDNPYASASQRIATFVASHTAAGHVVEPFFTTNNFALPAERFRELGGFDESIPSWTAEDKEFCDRWRDHGYPMIWVPGAVVDHSHPLTLRRFILQHYDYGRGILSFRRRRKPRKGKRLVPEPPQFYRNLVMHPLRQQRDALAWKTVALLALSQAATVAGATASLVDELRGKGVRGDAVVRDPDAGGA